MRVTILGSGTSTGVPIPGCDCHVCGSSDPHNKRLRTSVYVELEPAEQQQVISRGENRNSSAELLPYGVLIDTSTDLREQALRFGIRRVNSVLYTHTHADHVCGIDDLRSFNFVMKQPISIYASRDSTAELQRMFYYAFETDPDYQGGAPPQLELNTLEPYQPLTLAGVDFLPLALKHGRLDVLGFRIKNFAYLTDCSLIPDQTRELLNGLDVLVLDGLRVRPHRTHFNHEQAVAEIERIKPKRSFLTHITHEVDHDEGNKYLQLLSTQAVELAYDGLQFNF